MTVTFYVIVVSEANTISKESEKEEVASSSTALTSGSKTEVSHPDRGADKPPRGEILKEQDTNVPASEVTHGKSEKRTVSISETVMVVDDDGGSSKRSLATTEEQDEGEGKKMKKGAGSSRGRRGRRVVADVHLTAEDAQMNECKQQ